MTASVRGEIEAWADGKVLKVEKQQTLLTGMTKYRIQLEDPVTRTSKVALRIKHDHGFYGGSALPEPITLECGPGMMTTGDWSKTGALENYSGGAWYRKTVTLTPEQTRNKVILNMGHVIATAEVYINGNPAGIRVAPPWNVDVSEFVKPGENFIEILVYNTLANHYLTIPTRYRGSLLSGLIGPVQMEFK